MTERLTPSGATSTPYPAELTDASLTISPNPMRQTTHIRFAVPGGSAVDAAVYDVRGRRVRSLLRASDAPEGNRLIWDGRSDAGSRAPAGVYFVRLQSKERVLTEKVTLVR